MREATVEVGERAFDAVGIDALLEIAEAAGLREVESLACRGDGAVLQLETASRLDEEALSALEWVDEWHHVAEYDDGHEYVLAFTAPDVPAAMVEAAEGLVGTCEPELDGRTATLSLVGQQDSIAGTVAAYEDAGASPELRALAGYEGSERPLDALTERQREVLETAHEMGYYGVPRTASVDDVATELGLDDSTVAEHLQRAERNLLDELLG